MENKHLPTSSQLSQNVLSQDFKKKQTKKHHYPNDPPYLIRCKNCGKKHTVPTEPITKTRKIYCECGTHLMTLADSSYSIKTFIQKEEKETKNPIQEMVDMSLEE